ncbi:hypothetical protein GUJ93_ZPchr0013g37871 [Zizania palustris]|uniref:60S ribosomal protein L41 n=1 Tax=Zizania palustris TaxID=103762 RepID=A0A8J5WZU6_ZIZPA|nr:hypothetical protein GUJ93_ZPchr0013g36719 [Zizania palustris]KAG8098398.1 hypothetical protein GUJ93_ZPchr0013g37871 [Zizania palustris]
MRAKWKKKRMRRLKRKRRKMRQRSNYRLPEADERHKDTNMYVAVKLTRRLGQQTEAPTMEAMVGASMS